MLEVRLLGGKCEGNCLHDIKLAPSKEATLNMVSLLVEDTSGTRHWANAALAVPDLHPWMRHWEGLGVMESPNHKAADENFARKSPSWFLEEWMEGMHHGGEQ